MAERMLSTVADALSTVRVVMDSGPLEIGADSVALSAAAVVEGSSALRLGVIFYGATE